MVVFVGDRDVPAPERGLAATVVNQCAQALERARLYAAEAAARSRTERLQRMTAALAATLDEEEVARLIVSEGMAALDAIAGVLMLREGEGVRVLAATGYPPDVLAAGMRLPADAPLPLVEVLQDRAALLVRGARGLAGELPGPARGAQQRRRRPAADPGRPPGRRGGVPLRRGRAPHHPRGARARARAGVPVLVGAGAGAPARGRAAGPRGGRARRGPRPPAGRREPGAGRAGRPEPALRRPGAGGGAAAGRLLHGARHRRAGPVAAGGLPPRRPGEARPRPGHLRRRPVAVPARRPGGHHPLGRAGADPPARPSGSGASRSATRTSSRGCASWRRSPTWASR